MQVQVSSSPKHPPRQSSRSYEAFRDEAVRVAGLLDLAARLIRRRNDLFRHVDLLDRAIADANGLRELAIRFDRWPTMRPDAVEKERAELVEQLFTRMRDSLDLLRSLPNA